MAQGQNSNLFVTLSTKKDLNFKKEKRNQSEKESSLFCRLGLEISTSTKNYCSYGWCIKVKSLLELPQKLHLFAKLFVNCCRYTILYFFPSKYPLSSVTRVQLNPCLIICLEERPAWILNSIYSARCAHLYAHRSQNIHIYKMLNIRTYTCIYMYKCQYVYNVHSHVHETLCTRYGHEARVFYVQYI